MVTDDFISLLRTDEDRNMSINVQPRYIIILKRKRSTSPNRSLKILKSQKSK